MGWEDHVGRVGALAVALGIGSAVAAMPAVAWAQPDGATSASGSASPAGEHTTTTADKPSSGAAESAGTDDDSQTSPRKKYRSRTDASAERRAAAPADERRAERILEQRTRADADTPRSSPKPTAPELEPGTVLKTLFSPRPSSRDVDEPSAPPETPLPWTMLAYARRHLGSPTSTEVGTTAATSSTVQTTGAAGADEADDTAAPIFGSPAGPVVIAGDSIIYQVTTSAYWGTTQVSVLDSAGQVLATTDAIAGRPNSHSSAIARPDGTLVVVTTDDEGTRSTITVVDTDGTATRLATVNGQPSGVTVASNGAVYIPTFISTWLTPWGYRDLAEVYVSPSDLVRSFKPSAVGLAPDGTAYLVSSRAGRATLVTIRPNGSTKTTPVPHGGGTAPVFDQNGNAYLAVGVRNLFGGETTQLYTLDGTSTTVRTIAGSPGQATVMADGLILTTTTGFETNSVDGTTYISRITADTIDTFYTIPGGTMTDLHVTPGGTVYLSLDQPSLGTTRVDVMDGSGNVGTLTLPGTLERSGANNPIDGTGPQAGDNGYVTYSSGGTTYLAVLDPDATVARTVTLPEGAAVEGPVFSGPDGATYQLIEYRNAQGEVLSQQILALSTATFTPIVSGSPFFRSPNVQFGPDGTGYLINNGEQFQGISVLGFNASGETVVTLNLPTMQVLRDVESKTLVFATDGTAYATVFGPDGASVYALTASGATNVLQLGYRASFPVVVGPDGTAYLTTSDGSGSDTVVTAIAPPAVP